MTAVRQVLVTGAAGLVGVETVERLRRDESLAVVATSRRRSAAAVDAIGWDIGAEEPPPALRREWAAIVHAAADTRWTLPAEDAERANAATVEAVAALATERTHVVHVSTAYAAGARGGGSSPSLDDYRNSYEWSKALAERRARTLFERLTIVRPPLIVGRRGDGRAARFAGMYTILRAITASMVPVVVAEPDAYFDVVPVDEVARLLAACAGAEPAGTLTIAAGPAAPPVSRAFELMTASLNGWRTDRGLEPFDTPKLITTASWNRFFLPFARDQLTKRQLRILDLLSYFEPYLALTEPLAPTHQVVDVEPCIEAAVRYWASAEERQASLAPKPWKAAA